MRENCFLAFKLNSHPLSLSLHQEPQTGDRLGKKMESIVYNVARKHFMLNNFDDCAQYHIDEINFEENEQNILWVDNINLI